MAEVVLRGDDLEARREAEVQGGATLARGEDDRRVGEVPGLRDPVAAGSQPLRTAAAGHRGRRAHALAGGRGDRLQSRERSRP